MSKPILLNPAEIHNIPATTSSNSGCYSKLRGRLIQKIMHNPHVPCPWYTEIIKIILRALGIITAFALAIPTLGLSLYCMYDFLREEARLSSVYNKANTPQLIQGQPPTNIEECRTLQEKISSTERDFQQAQKEVLAATDKERALTTKIQELEKTLSQKDTEKLEATLAEVKQRAREQASLDTKKEQELNNQIEQLKHQAHAQTLQMQTEQANAKSELEKLKNNLTEAQREVGEKTKNIQQLQQELAQRNQEATNYAHYANEEKQKLLEQLQHAPSRNASQPLQLQNQPNEEIQKLTKKNAALKQKITRLEQTAGPRLQERVNQGEVHFGCIKTKDGPQFSSTDLQRIEQFLGEKPPEGHYFCVYFSTARSPSLPLLTSHINKYKKEANSKNNLPIYLILLRSPGFKPGEIKLIEEHEKTFGLLTLHLHYYGDAILNEINPDSIQKFRNQAEDALSKQ